MAEEFEFQDLSGASFWSVDLEGATFRDVDLTGARIAQARVVDVEIDAVVDRLVVNGVDVTAYVDEHDPWYPVRANLPPADPDGARRGWEAIDPAWTAAIDRARSLPDEQRHASVDGQWSFVQTLRHLVFATDKWFTVPVGGGAFHPIGLPNTGSIDFGWPGLDLAAEPTFDEAVAAWRVRWDAVRDHVAEITRAAMDADVEVLENGTSAVRDCIGVVYEEHFEHLRYALRDLDRLG